jgi:hypothetical protein
LRQHCRQNIEIEFAGLNDNDYIGVARDRKTITMNVLPPVCRFSLPDGFVRLEPGTTGGGLLPMFSRRLLTSATLRLTLTARRSSMTMP